MKPKDKDSNLSKIILGIGAITAVIIASGLIYRLQMPEEVDSEAIVVPVPQQEEAVMEKPVIPEADIPEPEPVAEVPPAPPEEPAIIKPGLPDLDDSDAFLRELMEPISSHQNFLRWIATDDLLRRLSSYLDGLSRGVILSKIFPLTAPDEKFTTHRDGKTIWLNAGNYERYNQTVDALVSLDMEAFAKLFHLVRPLLEASFAEMGYTKRQMEGIILQAIDRILSTPIILEPIELTRESVLYQFADPDLEALLPVQKQILRTGPENTQKIQQQVLVLKNALLNP